MPAGCSRDAAARGRGEAAVHHPEAEGGPRPLPQEIRPARVGGPTTAGGSMGHR